MSDDLVPVPVACKHAEPHETDTVYLRPRLGLAAGIAIQRLIVDAHNAKASLDAAEVSGVLAEAYLLHGVADWTLGPPVTPESIRSELLADFERAAPVADVADDLYMGPVIAPLVKKALTSLPSTSTNGSTSAHGNGAPPTRKRSKRSSTSTSQTVATATTSR